MSMPASLMLQKSDLLTGDVMASILPEDLHGDIPAGFNIAGHVGMLLPSTVYSCPCLACP
jgi:tRNA (guanine37-N1)-methyltransferase